MPTSPQPCSTGSRTVTLLRKTRAEEAAYKWINFVMRPDIAKMMSSHSGYVTARKDGGDLTSDQLKESFNDAFSKEDVANIKWFANIPPGLEDLEGKVLERIKDEPLGALDLKLREQMKIELKMLQSQFGTTFVYITHDQSEALVMSDRVAVMNHGRFEQVVEPREFYHDPTTAFVAGFVGDSNRWPGRVLGRDPAGVQVETDSGLTLTTREAGGPLQRGDAVEVFVRPESISIAGGTSPDGPDASGERNRAARRCEARGADGASPPRPRSPSVLSPAARWSGRGRAGLSRAAG